MTALWLFLIFIGVAMMSVGLVFRKELIGERPNVK